MLNGCDSIITTNLTVLSISISSVTNNITICDGDSVVVGNNVYYNSGSYTDVLLNSSGCDSTIITNLTVQTPIYQEITICDGDSVVVGSSVYYSSGSYVDTLLSSFSCDSIIYTEVIVILSLILYLVVSQIIHLVQVVCLQEIDI